MDTQTYKDKPVPIAGHSMTMKQNFCASSNELHFRLMGYKIRARYKNNLPSAGISPSVLRKGLIINEYHKVYSLEKSK